MKLVSCFRALGLATLLASSALQADSPALSEYFTEAALVFNSSSLENNTLPATIRRAHFPAVFRNDIHLRCISLKGYADTILVYLPQSGHCLRLDDLRQSQGRQETDGMNWRPGFETEYQALNRTLQSSNFVAILPQAQSRAPAGTCSCEGNQAPVVVVDAGQNLAVTVGDPVQIEFSATDLDSDILMETFSFQLDGAASQAGLPAGLAENCTRGVGTLSCTVTGAAPAVTGVYTIRLEVSDGLASGFATATLTVHPAGLIFTDGFEETP